MVLQQNPRNTWGTCSPILPKTHMGYKHHVTQHHRGSTSSGRWEEEWPHWERKKKSPYLQMMPSKQKSSDSTNNYSNRMSSTKWHNIKSVDKNLLHSTGKMWSLQKINFKGKKKKKQNDGGESGASERLEGPELSQLSWVNCSTWVFPGPCFARSHQAVSDARAHLTRHSSSAPVMCTVPPLQRHRDASTQEMQCGTRHRMTYRQPKGLDVPQAGTRWSGLGSAGAHYFFCVYFSMFEMVPIQKVWK